MFKILCHIRVVKKSRARQLAGSTFFIHILDAFLASLYNINKLLTASLCPHSTV